MIATIQRHALLVVCTAILGVLTALSVAFHHAQEKHAQTFRAPHREELVSTKPLIDGLTRTKLP